MKRLVIINHEPLTEHTKRLWMLDALNERGVDVSYWDICGVLKKNVEYPHLIDDNKLTVVQTFQQFKALLKMENMGKTLFVDEFPYTWHNLWLRIYLKLMNCKLVRINVFSYSVAGGIKIKENIVMKAIHKIPKWSLLKISSLFKLQQYEAFFSPIENEKENTIRINLPDYEVYLKHNNDKLKERKIIVFIDENIPLHPDFKIFYGYVYTTEDVISYRSAMKRVFDSLESRYGMKVVIAAHPKSKYSGGEFGERDIVYGKTCELILSSAMVLSHNSVADSYAILADKPIAYIYPNLFKRISNDSRNYKLLMEKAKQLGLNTYNIDEDPVDFIIPRKVEHNIRKNYIYSNLTSKESENKQSADIIANYLTNA